MDRVGAIMAFEDGSLGVRGVLELFADLVRTGDAWTLQGAYGRTARGLIERGLLTRGGEVTPLGEEAIEAHEAEEVPA